MESKYVCASLVALGCSLYILIWNRWEIIWKILLGSFIHTELSVENNENIVKNKMLWRKKLLRKKCDGFYNAYVHSNKEQKLIWSGVSRVAEREWIPYKAVQFQNNKQWYWVFTYLKVSRKVVNQRFREHFILPASLKLLCLKWNLSSASCSIFCIWYPCTLPQWAPYDDFSASFLLSWYDL